MTKWLSMGILGALMTGGTLMAADANAGREISQRLLSESQAAKEQASAMVLQLRRGNDLAGLGERAAAIERHAESIRSLLGELDGVAVLNARQQEALATAKTTAEVLRIMLNNKKTALDAGNSKSARESARQFARAVETRAETLERLVRQMGL
jgi:uncharacterized protein with PIN domain